jgi:hypothetical protein
MGSGLEAWRNNGLAVEKRAAVQYYPRGGTGNGMKT